MFRDFDYTLTLVVRVFGVVKVVGSKWPLWPLCLHDFSGSQSLTVEIIGEKSISL